jgi:SAM-dependent methyltransferase
MAHGSAGACAARCACADHHHHLGHTGIQMQTGSGAPSDPCPHRPQVAAQPAMADESGLIQPMSVLKDSWSAFSRDIAKVYLDGFGHPSEHSKLLVLSLLRETFEGRRFKIADFGCGNAHLYAFMKERGIACEYFGYDFSATLLAAARERFGQDPGCHLVEADIGDPTLAAEPCNVVLYSHVLEMLSSPERSLLAARRAAPLVMIRFFEPPVAEHDLAELLRMNIGGEPVPYLRRTMSRDYYNMILSKLGCRSIEVHQVDGDKDQVHLLRFA